MWSLLENGFTEKQANALVYFQKDIIDSELATKKDIEQLRADTKKDMAILEYKLTIKLGSIMTAGIVVLGALIIFFN